MAHLELGILDHQLALHHGTRCHQQQQEHGPSRACSTSHRRAVLLLPLATQLHECSRQSLGCGSSHDGAFAAARVPPAHPCRRNLVARYTSSFRFSSARQSHQKTARDDVVGWACCVDSLWHLLQVFSKTLAIFLKKPCSRGGRHQGATRRARARTAAKRCRAAVATPRRWGVAGAAAVAVGGAGGNKEPPLAVAVAEVAAEVAAAIPAALASNQRAGRGRRQRKSLMSRLCPPSL